MTRVWKHALVGLGAAAGIAVLAPACSHENSTLFVYSVLAPQLVSVGQACVYTSDPGQARLTHGILDTAFRDEYDGEFLVASQLIALGDPSQGKTETQYFDVQGAVVRITDAQGNDLKSFTRLTSATINPAPGATPSYAPIDAVVLDRDTILSADVQNALSSGQFKRLVTYTRFFGVTLGGTYVESGEYEFPIDVCYGCLIDFSAADVSPYYPFPNCVGNSMTGGASSSLPIPCERGQDFAVDCSSCQDVLACHGVVPVIIDAGAPG